MRVQLTTSPLAPPAARPTPALRAADGDYKTKGVGHEVKDADGDYKPTSVTPAAPPLKSVSANVQAVLLNLKTGGA